MRDIADESLDAVVCAGVLEHLYDVVKGVGKLQRLLKPGGKLLVMMTFAFPYHTDADIWRLIKTTYRDLFKDMWNAKLIFLGNVYSTIACILQRPVEVISMRFLSHKVVGCLFASMVRFGRVDGFSEGYGFYGVKH